MQHIGHLGSSVLLLPASLVLIAILAWSGRRRDCLGFAAALVVCLAATLTAKLAFRACSFDPSSLESPSGHASLSAMFYGCCALILAGGRPLVQKVVIYGGGAALVMAIGAGRVLAYAHSWQEVVVGTALGLVPVFVFGLLRGTPTRVSASNRALLTFVPAALACAAGILIVARHWTPEPLIERAAIQLDLFLQVCS